jgi:UDP-N-acetylmuramyl pentapeptide synthase
MSGRLLQRGFSWEWELKILEALGKYQPGNNRSQVKTTDKNTLICDSYNANPPA